MRIVNVRGWDVECGPQLATLTPLLCVEYCVVYTCIPRLLEYKDFLYEDLRVIAFLGFVGSDNTYDTVIHWIKQYVFK